jgi:hypothetical protein
MDKFAGFKKPSRKMLMLLQEAEIAAWVYYKLPSPDVEFAPVPKKSHDDLARHKALTADFARRGLMSIGIVALLKRDTPEGHALVETEFAFDVPDGVDEYVKDEFKRKLMEWGVVKPLAAEA